MTYQLRYRIVEFLRTSRRAIVPMVIALATAYFGLYAVYGPKGFGVRAERERALALAAAELGLLEEDRLVLERRVRLLGDKAIDPDLLEEEARRVLNRADIDEVIVLMSPAAGATAPSVETQR